jgi:transposase
MEHIAGADLHKRVTQLALLRDGRPPSQARFANDPVVVEGVLKWLLAGTTIAVESMGSWWWFVDTARRLGHQVVLSHPKLTKAIASARLKSDKVDAVMLARLLKADLLSKSAHVRARFGASRKKQSRFLVKQWPTIHPRSAHARKSNCRSISTE